MTVQREKHIECINLYEIKSGSDFIIVWTWIYAMILCKSGCLFLLLFFWLAEILKASNVMVENFFILQTKNSVDSYTIIRLLATIIQNQPLLILKLHSLQKLIFLLATRQKPKYTLLFPQKVLLLGRHFGINPTRFC